MAERISGQNPLVGPKRPNPERLNLQRLELELLELELLELGAARPAACGCGARPIRSAVLPSSGGR